MAVKEAQPLLMDEHPSAEEGAFAIAPPSMTENVLFDYQSTGLTLRTHPWHSYGNNRRSINVGNSPSSSRWVIAAL